jgi:hypothetical protein
VQGSSLIALPKPLDEQLESPGKSVMNATNTKATHTNSTSTNATITRDTFLSLEELLKGIIQSSQRAEEEVELRASQLVEPYSLAVREIAGVQREIVSVIEGFARNCPRNILQTSAQYTLGTAQQTVDDDALQAVDRLISLNKQTVECLDEQAQKTVPEGVRAALEPLIKEVETLAQRVSMIRLTMQDS